MNESFVSPFHLCMLKQNIFSFKKPVKKVYKNAYYDKL